MNNDMMMQPKGEQSITAFTPEQVGGLLLQTQQLMQSMANAMAAMNQRMGQLEKQVRQLTPITGAQEKALGEKVRQRAETLADEYRLDAKAVPLIASAIRKDIKLEGGVRALRELPRVEYPVYVERIALWDDYGAMKAIRKAHKGK